jgi:hypothetical protein
MRKSRNGWIKRIRYLCLTGVIFLGLITILGSNGDGGGTATTTPETDATAPTVSSISPVDAATGVEIYSTIKATFSEAMDASTINDSTFSVSSGGDTVAGTITSSGETATFIPSRPLNPDITYTSTITSGVKDSAGNSMESDYSWGFTTTDTNGTVTLNGTLLVGVATSSIEDAGRRSASTENYTAQVLDTVTGEQRTAAVSSDGSFELTARTSSKYIINFLDDNTNYLGTMATGDVSDDDTVPVSLVTGSDGSTANLGTVTANSTTGQITSSETLETDAGQLAHAVDGVIAGGNTGEGTVDYAEDVGLTCSDKESPDCPDDDFDGVPDIMDTDNDNDGYADEISAACDYCTGGTVKLYIENYSASATAAEQEGFPTPTEVDTNAGASHYNIILEVLPPEGGTVDDIQSVSATTPDYIDDYGYVYGVENEHECFNTLWTECIGPGGSGKELLKGTDRFEMKISDIELDRAGIINNMAVGDTFIFHITMTDGTTHICTRKIGVIPKYYAYAFKKGDELVDTSACAQTWGESFNLSWTIPGPPHPAGQTYKARFVPYSACDTWDPETYWEKSAGQDGTSVSITKAELDAEIPSDINFWSVTIYNIDEAGDESFVGPVNFTTEGANPCPCGG